MLHDIESPIVASLLIQHQGGARVEHGKAQRMCSLCSGNCPTPAACELPELTAPVCPSLFQRLLTAVCSGWALPF